MAEVMVMWEEQVPHAETKMGGIHIASLCLSPPPPFQTTQPWNKPKCKQNIGNAKPQCLARSQERQSSQLESTRGAEQLRAEEATPRLGASAWLTVGLFTHVSELKLYMPDFQK